MYLCEEINCKSINTKEINRYVGIGPELVSIRCLDCGAVSKVLASWLPENKQKDFFIKPDLWWEEVYDAIDITQVDS